MELALSAGSMWSADLEGVPPNVGSEGRLWSGWPEVLRVRKGEEQFTDNRPTCSMSVSICFELPCRLSEGISICLGLGPPYSWPYSRCRNYHLVLRDQVVNTWSIPESTRYRCG